MNNNSDNNIFDQIKSKFRDPSPLNESWNTPPDFVFQEAIEQVNFKKKNRSKKYLFSLLLLLFLFGLFLTQFYYNHKLISLEDQMNVLTSQIQDATPEKITQSHNLTRSELTNSNDQIHTSPYIPTSENNTEQIKLRKEKFPTNEGLEKQNRNSALESYFQNNATSSSSNQIEIIFKEDGLSSSAFNAQIASLSQKPMVNSENQTDNVQNSKTQLNLQKSISNSYSQNMLNATSNLALIPVTKVYTHATSIPSILPTRELNTTSRSATSWLELGYIGNTSTLCMQGPLPNGSMLEKYDKYQSGFGLYLANNYSFSDRLFIQSTLQFNRFSNESSLNGTVNYEAHNEYNENGITMYENNMLMETPIGPVRSRESFSVNEFNSNEGDAMDYTSSIRQNLYVWSFKFGPGIHLYESNKINIFASMQAGYNYIYNLVGSMDTKMSMEEKALSSFTSEIDHTESLTKSFYTIDLHTGLSYKLSDQFRLNSGLGYAQSITTLRTDHTTTKLKNWSLNIGLSTSL